MLLRIDKGNVNYGINYIVIINSKIISFGRNNEKCDISVIHNIKSTNNVIFTS